MSEINNENWFEKIIGFNEKYFKYTLDEIPENIRNKMGNFETITIDELKNKIKKFKENKQDINLIVKYRKKFNNNNDFDTSALQFYSENNTLFQVASNFNCLEIPRVDYSPFNGRYLTNQMTDYTQGPSASGGAVFGSILRLIKHHKEKINLLEFTPLKPNNGKLKYSDNINFPDFNTDLIKIGLHLNVEANFLRSNDFEYKENNVRINQVFTSTCICKDNKSNNLNTILLEKAYEGTYLAGIITKAPRIVLTLIGGGVFNNSIQLICETIVKIHEKYSKYLPKDCVVELPIFEPSPFNTLAHFSNKNNVIIQLIE
jgi:hypothetical protein